MVSSQRLKVLHIGKFYPPQMGGIETHIQALCRALKDYVDVRVLVANHSSATQQASIDGIDVIRAGTKAVVASTPICPSMPELLRASDADLIHIHLPNPTGILSYLAAGKKRPVVVTYHSDTIKQKYLYHMFRPFQERVLARSAAIIATSHNYAKTSPVLLAHSDRCHVIPYGIPSDHFMQPAEDAVSEIRRAYGQKIILAVGRLVYYKGFEYLIRSMSRIDGRLLLIGEGPLRASLEILAVECGVAGRVAFLGDIKNDRLLPYYHAADVFVLPSIARSEAFGIVQIEAMAAGKPVVNTQLNSGVPTVSLNGVTGLTVAPGDSESLTQAINILLEDDDLRLNYGQAARLRALADFSLEAMVSRTLRVYNDIWGRQSGVAANRLSRQAALGH